MDVNLKKLQSMQNEFCVYRLRAVLDNPKYRGLSSRGHGILFDTLPERFRSRAWKVRRLAKTWIPPEVGGRVAKSNDYPCADMVVPVYSERAINALEDMLRANGEILPLRTKTGTYFAYNLTTIADVLVEKDSILKMDHEGLMALFLIKRVFNAERVRDLTIFRIPQNPPVTYVTSPFVSRVEQSGLKGFALQTVWGEREGGISLPLWKGAEKGTEA
jgi:hypothetical protein